jgi:hypothetical protein
MTKRIEDALFLWEKGRKETAFLVALVGIAASSKIKYPQIPDRIAFENFFKSCHTQK